MGPRVDTSWVFPLLLGFLREVVCELLGVEWREIPFYKKKKKIYSYLVPGAPVQ